ncbi:MAG: chemotaxis protein CheW [Bryobacteraceae bacterium]
MIDRTPQDWARHEEGLEPLAALLEDLLHSWDVAASGERSDAAKQPAPGGSEQGEVEQLFAALSQRLTAPEQTAAPAGTPAAKRMIPAGGEESAFDESFELSPRGSEAKPPAGFLWLSELPNAVPAESSKVPEPQEQPAVNVVFQTEAAAPVETAPVAPAAAMEAETEVPIEAAEVAEVPEAEIPEAFVASVVEQAAATAAPLPVIPAEAAFEGEAPSFEEFVALGTPAEEAAVAVDRRAEPTEAPKAKANLASDGGEVKVPISEYAPNDRYLLFRMSGSLFALSLPAVSEAERQPALTPVPGMPGFLRGIFSHRGEIVPLVHLPELLGLEQEEHPGAAGKIMIVKSPHGPLALAAESLEGLSGIYPHEIDHLAELGGTLRPAVRGTARLGNRSVCVLDLEKVFALEKLKDLVGADSAMTESV